MIRNKRSILLLMAIILITILMIVIRNILPEKEIESKVKNEVSSDSILVFVHNKDTKETKIKKIYENDMPSSNDKNKLIFYVKNIYSLEPIFRTNSDSSINYGLKNNINGFKLYFENYEYDSFLTYTNTNDSEDLFITTNNKNRFLSTLFFLPVQVIFSKNNPKRYLMSFGCYYNSINYWQGISEVLINNSYFNKIVEINTVSLKSDFNNKINNPKRNGFDNIFFSDFNESSDSLDIEIYDSYFEKINIGTKYISKFELAGNTMDELMLSNHTFLKDFSIDNCEIKNKISFTDCELYGLPSFESLILPDTIEFRNCIFKLDPVADRYSRIDFRNTIKTENKKCKILISNAPADKLLLSYSNFELVIDSLETFENITQIYEDLINTCKTNGMIESSKDWDIEYRTLLMRHNFSFISTPLVYFNKHWWNFGYSKWKILVIWLPSFFLMFLIINFIFIEYLTFNIYRDDEMEDSSFHFIKYLNYKDGQPDFRDLKFRIGYSIFYTASIYFGLKLKLNALNYYNFSGMFYIFLVYAIGSIHLAFSLSYILSVY